MYLVIKESTAVRTGIDLLLSERYSGDRMPQRSKLSLMLPYSLLAMVMRDMLRWHSGDCAESGMSLAFCFMLMVSSLIPISWMDGLWRHEPIVIDMTNATSIALKIHFVLYISNLCLLRFCILSCKVSENLIFTKNNVSFLSNVMFWSPFERFFGHIFRLFLVLLYICTSNHLFSPIDFVCAFWLIFENCYICLKK